MTDLDDAVATVRDREDLPREDGDVSFEAPWQARAFAVVVTLYRQGRFEWNEFQARLIEEIRDADAGAAGAEAAYYRSWIAAAESLLEEEGLVPAGDLRARIEDFESGRRDASEFVVGVDHDHDHAHGEAGNREGKGGN